MEAENAANDLLAEYGETALANDRLSELLQLAWLNGHRASDFEAVQQIDALMARIIDGAQ